MDDLLLQQFDVVYLSGPMSGLPDFNKPAFRAAEVAIKKLYPTIGFHNPGTFFDNYPKKNLSYEQMMKINLHKVVDCTVIVRLRNWVGSRGCFAEHVVASICGLRFLDYCELCSPCLAKAVMTTPYLCPHCGNLDTQVVRCKVCNRKGAI